MTKLPIIEMSEISEYIVTNDHFQRVLSIADVDASTGKEGRGLEEYTDPVRLNALFVVLVLKGTVSVSLDYVPYTLSENSILTIMPAHIFQAADASNDFKARLIMVDKVFLEEINTENRSPSMTNYMLMRKNPHTELQSDEVAYLDRSIGLLRDKIRMRTHSFHKELLQNAFVGFLLEMANILIGKKDNMIRPALTRKEEILNQFLQLLFTNAKEEHNVSYYAEKLCITPQYLSLILKELTGKSANKWIDDVLIVEAKLLLKMPQTTVQQVADQLNFSDQSTFGKFFKKQMGVSPLEYRKS